MDKKYNKLFKGTCKSCKENNLVKENNWVCGNNPLHVMFKFLNYTEEGRRLASYMYSPDSKYTLDNVYGWLYDGLNDTNKQNVQYERMGQYYEGIVYSLGKNIAKLPKKS